MKTRIAVFTGEDGEAAPFRDRGKITLYQREQGRWRKIGEKPFTLGPEKNLRELRQKIQEALDFMKGCSVFVCRAVGGISYYELEKAGISVWECDGKPRDFLDYVLAREEEKNREEGERERAAFITTVEGREGYYRISLKEAQKNMVGLTSKQILLPLLRDKLVHELEVICSHVPPWLERYLEENNWQGKVEETRCGDIKIVISKRKEERKVRKL